MVPPSHMQMLYAKAAARNNQCLFVDFPTGMHMDTWLAGGDQYWRTIQQFLEQHAPEQKEDRSSQNANGNFFFFMLCFKTRMDGLRFCLLNCMNNIKLRIFRRESFLLVLSLILVFCLFLFHCALHLRCLSYVILKRHPSIVAIDYCHPL